MKKIIHYLRLYLSELHAPSLVLSLLFISLSVFVNYYFGLNHRIAGLPERWQYGAWYLVFAATWWTPYFAYRVFGLHHPFGNGRFAFLLLLAPALFAWKMVFEFDFSLSSIERYNLYWNQVLYWPVKFLCLCAVLYLIWRCFGGKGNFYGASLQEFRPRPYVLMLLMMVPLVAAASTQADFLITYPKLKHLGYLGSDPPAWRLWLFELSYGSDFFTIELFFRGFLVLAFARWVGKDAILPMACFYCAIHFGKPLGECISSFFGGILLGVITYHTRTIAGGLMVHLGIAWLMELGGYLGGGMR